MFWRFAKPASSIMGPSMDDTMYFDSSNLFDYEESKNYQYRLFQMQNGIGEGLSGMKNFGI